MSEIDLLRALPKVKRDIQMRKDAKDPAVVAISSLFLVGLILLCFAPETRGQNLPE